MAQMRDDSQHPPGRQEQAPKQRCTFSPTTFSSVQSTITITMVRTALLMLMACSTAASASPPLPGKAAALAAATKAAKYYIKSTNFTPACGWERGPFMLGLAQLAKANGDSWDTQWPHDILMEFGEHFSWELCGSHNQGTNARVNDGNNQLCGATYAEIYALGGSKNKTLIASTVASKHQFIHPIQILFKMAPSMQHAAWWFEIELTRYVCRIDVNIDNPAHEHGGPEGANHVSTRADLRVQTMSRLELTPVVLFP